MTMIPMYNTKKFTDYFPKVSDFILSYHTNGLPEEIKEDTVKTLYYLLYARYGNNPIANYDEHQFELKLFSIVYQYGPTWEKRLDIQKTLRNMSEEKLLQGAKQIYNTAMNPDTAPSTAQLEEIGYINQQNTSNVKKSIIGAYQDLWELLKLDVTEEFIKKFKILFKTVVIPEMTYIYEGDE